ncbi:MAG: cold shock domain-containing protein [Gammaproteobacteria bacterium]
MKGVIATWKQDKGFGFIRPEGGGTDVFVHIRDFGNISRAPRVGDVVSFQPMKGEDGRSRAADVHIDGLPRIPATKPPVRGIPVTRRRRGRASIGFVPVLLLALVVVGALFNRESKSRIEDLPAVVGEQRVGVQDAFQCEGKRHCSEMTSCAEATFYLRHCPNTEMDGDGDGTPCESQWCN